MSLTAAELIKADHEHLIHPLHHPSDNAEPIVYVRGRGATVVDVTGHEYLDGLSGLWNVNVGHGRKELAQAAAAQMEELAYFSGYVGSSSIPAVAPSPTSRRSRPRDSTGRRGASPARSRLSHGSTPTTGSRSRR
jgi:4-aminobutyrate aminotransferase-like enzyme